MILLAALLLAAAAPIAAPPASPRWRIQYFLDEDQRSFSIADLAFSSPERGIAVGTLYHKKGRPQPYSVITRDGGLHWTPVPINEFPVSLYVLNDNSAWMVTAKGLWRTDEAGRSWKKIKSSAGLRRVYFRDELNGWLTGAPKLFQRTRDGGKTWTAISEAAAIKSDPVNSYFDWMEFENPQRAIVLGAHVAPRRDKANWMDPEQLSHRREWPGLNITLETRDGGETWSAQTLPSFGRFSRFRSAHGPRKALALIRFVNTFDYPSEVYLTDAGGKGQRVFRDPRRDVTDVIWFNSTAYLVAVEPQGKLHQLPVPGKLHVLASPDARTWQEMKVDYRAFAQQAVFASAGSNLWIATDSGQILKLIP